MHHYNQKKILFGAILSTCEIHSIYVFNGLDEPSEIKISRRYRTELTARTIRVFPDSGNEDIPKENRVQSFTTLFGKNGVGKTSLLCDLCRTGSEDAKSRPLGILCSIDGELMLYRGRVLSQWEIGDGSVIPKLLKKAPLLDTIFYSTSPFEATRIAELREYGVLNISPFAGGDSRFDGLSLILHSEYLTGTVANEWLNKEVDLRGRLSRQSLPSQQLQLLLKRHGYESEAGLISYATKTFKHWLVNIPNAEQEILSANLTIISDIENNGNVVGHFVSELLALASKVKNKEQPSSPDEWKLLLQLSSSVIQQSQFIIADGAKVLEFLQSLAIALGETEPGRRFNLSTTPDKIKQVLDSLNNEYPGLARFSTDLGFLSFTLKELSSGQFALLYLYASIGSALSKVKFAEREAPVFLLIDEGEMFLHPAWQREYIAGILDFVGKFQVAERKVHVMISTHSLIVAADSPPFSLFDVEAGEGRNGFGYGPRSTLGDVYGVSTFAGQYTAEMVDELVNYLKRPKARTTDRIRRLSNALADPELRHYIEEAMRNRGGL